MPRKLRDVAAIMNPNITVVSPDTTADVAAGLMVEDNSGKFPKR